MDGKMHTLWIEYVAYNIDLDEMITSGVMLLDEMFPCRVLMVAHPSTFPLLFFVVPPCGQLVTYI